MDAKDISKIDVSAKLSMTERRSQRIRKRDVSLTSLASKDSRALKSVRKKSVKKCTKPTKSKPFEELPVIEESTKKRRKRKSVTYEIDCSGINIIISDLQKDLWNRAKNGKLNSAKKVRIKQNGNTILIKSASYVSKKCVRSNVIFLVSTYLKQKKLDRAVHLVGDGNRYKLVYTNKK